MELNTKQEIAVFDLPGNTIITASPGSGKTRSLIARAMHKLDIAPRYKDIALITYTNAGADEIASRLVSEKGVFIGTIHSFCLEYILRPFSWIYHWHTPQIISHDQQIEFFEKYTDIELDNNFGQNRFDELSKIKKRLDGSLDTNILWNHSVSLEEVSLKYYDHQRSLNVIDFNEILYRSYKLIIENKFIAKSLSSRFFEILVDEFQDTNQYQYEIFKAICNIGPCTFFLVGDDKQQIFSFAGAIKDSFAKARVDFDALHEDLTETYRSTDNIVGVYSGLFEEHPLIENRAECKDLDIKVKVIKTNKSNHQYHLENIVDHLVGDCQIQQSEIAVLSTSWYNALSVSKILRPKYNVVGTGALPHKYINNSTTSLLRSLARHVSSPNVKYLRGVKRNVDMHLLENGLVFSDSLLHTKINKLVSLFLSIPSSSDLNYGLLHIKSIFDDIFQLSHSTFDEIIDNASDAEMQLFTIEQYLKTLAGLDGITSNTIHKVKGLEFDAVILNEMNENKIPYQKLLCRKTWEYEPLSEDDIATGKNLFYVAVSRARKHLIVLHNWKPSMFVEITKKAKGISLS